MWETPQNDEPGKQRWQIKFSANVRSNHLFSRICSVHCTLRPTLKDTQYLTLCMRTSNSIVQLERTFIPHSSFEQTSLDSRELGPLSASQTCYLASTRGIFKVWVPRSFFLDRAQVTPDAVKFLGRRLFPHAKTHSGAKLNFAVRKNVIPWPNVMGLTCTAQRPRGHSEISMFLHL